MTDHRSMRDRMLAGDLYIADDPVVTRDLPPDVLALGSPARVVRPV